MLEQAPEKTIQSGQNNSRRKNSAGAWIAELALEYAKTHGKTRLIRKAFNGPLTVQKPFYPETDVCHTYLIHPPGGIVGGDQLFLDIKMGADAHALITTPGANKFYRSAEQTSLLQQNLKLAKNSSLEFLPQETILFDGSFSRLNTVFDIHESSRLIAWDIVCLGRPASNALFDSGNCVQQLQLRRNQQPYLSERSVFDPRSESFQSAWGVAGFQCLAYLIAYPVSKESLVELKKLEFHETEQRLSITLLRNVLVCRYLGYHAESAKHNLQQVWQQLRPLILNRTASTPRIWNT